MPFLKMKRPPLVCQKTGKSLESGRKNRWLILLLPITGLLALIWFLIRVVPKPSRMMYPCQRVAFPLASGFVIWLIGILGSVAAMRRARRYFRRARYVVGILCVTVSVGFIWLALSGTAEKVALADDPVPSAPIGVAKGIHPGRVVWAHNPDATDWDGAGYGHWWESSHTDQNSVDEMLSRSLVTLANEPNDVIAWDSIFRYFNQTHSKGDVGYQSGEKITIKVNFVGTHFDAGAVDTETYELLDGYWIDYHHVGPQMMLAVLRQLVYNVDVNQADIAIGDTLCYFSKNFWEPLHDEFPNVQYLDYAGGNAENSRTGVGFSGSALYWSNHPAGNQDYAPQSYEAADYIINIANLKTHGGAAITLGGKNHFGSLVRWPAEAGYYDLHTSAFAAGMGNYRVLVDLMGHPDIGGKTVLYMIDGLWGGEYAHADNNVPIKFSTSPFDGDWTSSILVSQDAVAIDSVGFDILWTEFNDVTCARKSGGEDYLHEAALADNPPSGTFYDPNHDGDVVRLASLGTHEHWNNATDKQYSRNLDPINGTGIQLVTGLYTMGDFEPDGDVDFEDFAVLAAAWRSQPGDGNWNAACNISESIDGVIDEYDLIVFCEKWLN